MQDPFRWSVPLGRLFGVAVRIHVWFPVFALMLILRVAFQPPPEPPAPPPLPNLWVDACIILVLLFVAVLLHELGHCFGARLVDGDAHEVLLWPLGGLAAVEVPHTPRAHFVTAAAGPAVNLVLCCAMALVLAVQSFVPPLNPFANPLAPRLFHWGEKKFHFDPKFQHSPDRMKQAPEAKAEAAEVSERPAATEPAYLNGVDILVARFFWVNWCLLLINLLPGFPLDGGRMFQCFLWWRSDYRQATQSAVFAGYLVMFGFIIAGVVADAFFLLIAFNIWMACKMQLYLLEAGGDEPLFGYDFSQGYTSLERGEPLPPPAPRRKQPNFIQRWLQRRAARKLQQEQEQREYEEQRMDELLEKINREGKDALTDEENRFLKRVSDRYRNRH